MKSLEELNFKKNPFEMLTPSPNGDFVWAGMITQKEKISNAYENSFQMEARQLILNWGPVGGGKTFAAYYFKSKELYPGQNREIINVYVRTPKEGNNAFSQLFKDFIDNYSLTKIKSAIKNKIELYGQNTLEDILRESSISEEFSKAILKLANDEEKISNTMTSYVYGIASATDIKKVGLFRPLKSETDYVKFLSGIILILTYSTTVPTRLFFWIDEMEDMVYYNSKQFKQFSQSLRDLIDTVNVRFTVFLNFTLSEGEEDTVKTLLGEALWSRKNFDIRFKDFKIEDGVIYCKDLIHHYQIDKSVDFIPFDSSAITNVLGMLPTALLTPREINKKMSALLTFARENDATYIDDKVVINFENSLFD